MMLFSFKFLHANHFVCFAEFYNFPYLLVEVLLKYPKYSLKNIDLIGLPSLLPFILSAFQIS